MAKKLFGWTDKRYNQEYWGRSERNWNRWKESQWKKNQPGKRLYWKQLRKKKKLSKEIWG